jgi:hypothetical protein
MLLVYTKELPPGQADRQEMERVFAGHRAVMDEAAQRKVLVAAEPRHATSTATTIRRSGDRFLTIDGPFAETVEQLAGYYILDCRDLDEAMEWARRIPTACGGEEGSIEIRPLAWQT